MKAIAGLVLALVLIGSGKGQTKPVAPATPKPSTITADQRAAYWKAFAQQQGAQKQLEAAQAAITQAVQAMVAACGADESLTQAANGDPECVAILKSKPEVKK